MSEHIQNKNNFSKVASRLNIFCYKPQLKYHKQGEIKS